MECLHETSFGIIPLMKVEGEWKLFVILHKNGNHWGFPKGRPDGDENPRESAARELKEETNLKVERFLLGGEPISESYIFYRHGKKVEKAVTYFPALVQGSFILQPEEIRDGKWFSLADARERLTFDEARRVCDQTIKALNLS